MEKARLLFAFMSFDGPHLLILDEPTNHLDIDAREALVQALNNYEGAVIIVSHDPSMVERVADRLWLVRDGRVSDFEGDLEDYRRFTIQANREARKQEKVKDKKAKAAASDEAATEANPTPAGGSNSAAVRGGGLEASTEKRINPVTQQKQIRELEKDIAKLTKEKQALEELMAQTDFYKLRATGDTDRIAQTQKTYSTTCSQLEVLEAKWLELQA